MGSRMRESDVHISIILKDLRRILANVDLRKDLLITSLEELLAVEPELPVEPMDKMCLSKDGTESIESLLYSELTIAIPASVSEVSVYSSAAARG